MPHATFATTLESCKRLIEAHWVTPEQWDLEPLKREAGFIVPLNKNLVYLPRLTNPPPAQAFRGVRSLSDTVKLLILTQIDAHYLQRDEPMALQRWAAHFGMRTDGTNVVEPRQRATAVLEVREAPCNRSATGQESIQSCHELAQALGLPDRLMGDLLSAVFCQMCHQISRRQDGIHVGYIYHVPQTLRRHGDSRFVLSGYVCVACKAGFGMPARQAKV